MAPATRKLHMNYLSFKLLRYRIIVLKSLKQQIDAVRQNLSNTARVASLARPSSRLPSITRKSLSVLFATSSSNIVCCNYVETAAVVLSPLPSPESQLHRSAALHLLPWSPCRWGATLPLVWWHVRNGGFRGLR